jgi:hypothetical protein
MQPASTTSEGADMSYDVRGRMAEVCSCTTYCPCTAGLEPDGGTCDFNWVFHIDGGTIDGIDVAGLNLGFLGRLVGVPGPEGARVAVLVDERATDEQEAALLAAWTGGRGGPLAELASLVREVAFVERAAIEFDVDKGTGNFRIGDYSKAEVAALAGPTGQPTTINDFALAGVLGAVGYVGKPVSYHLEAGDHGFELAPGSATQFEFHHSA